MVNVVNFVEDYCQLFNPQDEMVGEIDTYVSLNHVRIQIKAQQLEGWYLLWPGPDFLRSSDQSDNLVRIDINSKGELSPWPNGFFSLLDNQLSVLHDLIQYDPIQENKGDQG